MARKRLCWLAAALGALPSAAYASDPVRAEEVFQEALTRSDAGDWEAACPMFAESDALDPSVGAMLNLAYCSERAGRLLESRARYEEAARRNEGTADSSRRAAVADQVRAALEKLSERTPRLKVIVSPGGAKVTIDGREVASSPDGALLDPGRHVVRVTATEHADAEREIVLAEAQRLEIAVGLTRLPRPAPVRPVHPPAPVSEPAPPPTLVPGIILLSAGVLAAGAGATLLGLTASDAAEVRELCGPNARPPRCAGTPADAARATELSHEAKTFEIAGGALAGAGAATLVTGLVLVLVGVQSEERAADTMGLTISPGGFAWTTELTF